MQNLLFYFLFRKAEIFTDQKKPQKRNWTRIIDFIDLMFMIYLKPQSLSVSVMFCHFNTIYFF